MKVLIVEDDRTNRVALCAIVAKLGHEVVTAPNGQEGFQLFEQERPDLVLMDVLMPVMDGYECALKIKTSCKGRFVPIIFLTAMTDDDELARCVASGGDDFLSKPYNYVLIKAKIDAMARIHDLYETLAQNSHKLEEYQLVMERELSLAHHVFQSVTRESPDNINPLNQWSRPVGMFSGDLLVYERGPTGQLQVMLGDFTGHGLAAAIGVIPVSDIFFSMTKKGFGIMDIAYEINRKLNRILPTGHFCAASLISIDREREGVEIWNGGLPPVLVIGDNGTVIRRVHSSKLPLGVVGAQDFDAQTEVLTIQEAHSILIYSDGLTEATNNNGEMFGDAGLEKAINFATSTADMFQCIKERISDFIGDRPTTDDISLVEVQCHALFDDYLSGTKHALGDSLASTWSLEVNLNSDTLKKVDPLPFFMNWLIQTHLPESQRMHIYTILAELINNAVDHGLLKLDSSTKSSPEGFETYYTRRRDLMDQLSSGSLTVRINQSPVLGGRLIKIAIQDTGNGFDFDRVYSSLDNNAKSFGRGIALVRSLCSKLTYQGCGNCVEAEYCG